MNTRRVHHDIPTTPITPQNTNIEGGQGRGQNPSLGRRTFIDDMGSRTNSSTRACHQGSSVKRSPIIPMVEALVSTVENTREAATPSCVLVEEDRVSTVGSADRDLIYHINEKVVTEEEWTQFHQKFNNQWKHEEDKA